MGRLPAIASRLDAQLDHQISRGRRPRDAKVWVETALRACLPPGVPPSWRSIDSASYKSGLPRHEAEAALTMFDGGTATVKVWLWGKYGSWAHQWLTMDGGSCSYENGRWIRLDPDTLQPFPKQADLFGAAA